MKKLMMHFVLYNLIGASGAFLDFVVYASLNHVTDIDYRIINVFSVLVGITNNFFWNHKFNFRTQGYVFRRYLSFLLIGCFGLLISTVLLTLMVEHLGIGIIFAKIITIFAVAIIQFILNKTITFRQVL